MSQWLMPNDFKPEVGHPFQFRTKPAPGFDSIVHCQVLEMSLPERLVYTWKGGGVDMSLHWRTFFKRKKTPWLHGSFRKRERFAITLL